ncbi:MAG TPA: PLP-dependent aminotransferase family protein [Anaerolineae bacterium]|nr:PLP-dependent aminotransferase family protein [Anaerolineae bacterium]
MFFSRLELDRDKSRALYLQVADHLRQRIESGDLTSETRLPASRVLAKQLGVNRVTVVNAYAELEAEGLVATRVGSGTYVTGPHQPPAPDEPTLEPVRLGSSQPRRYWDAGHMMTEMMRLARQPGVISFAAGTPASEFIPVNEFRRAINDVLRRDGAEALQYEEAAGYFPLRQVIAEMLQAQGIEAKATDILITAGCQQAVDITLRVLARSEHSALVVEEPCYLGLLDLLSSRRITPVGVPMDEHGLQVDQLEQIILRHRPSLIYVTPNFHNPTGITMPLGRRQALLEIAARYGVPILEDTTYDELYYDRPPLPTLKSLDTAGIVFQAGGFSKTLVPGIRIGYLVAPSQLQERLVATKQTTDILTSPLNQRALHAYLESGHFPIHLETVRNGYRTRRDAMLAAMAQHFPAEARWRCPAGGIYLWVEMPQPGPTATELYLTAINYNVAFSIGSVFSAGGFFAHAMRLNFAGCPPDVIEEGIRRLGKAWKELLARSNAMIEPRPASMHIL